VPSHYLHLAGVHADHPGERKGPLATKRGDGIL
jgi:hypothetical protein